MALVAQLVAAGSGAAVLPDERVVQRLAGGRVPDDHGLPLVCDADRVELAWLEAGVRERLAGDGVGDLPDLGGVVLDPAGLGEVLGELPVAAADQLLLVVEDQARAPSGPLVDREQHRDAGAYPPHRADLRPLCRRA